MTDMRNRSLAASVESRLAESRTLAGSDINVQSSQNGVILTGKVADDKAKRRAEVIAMRTRGVNNVQNQLTVDQAFVDQRRNKNVPDEQLSKNVAEQIAKALNARANEDWLSGWEVQAAQWEIEVDSDGGRVTLGGDAASRSDMQTAISTARDVPGVQSVENDMSLSARYGYGYDYPYYGYGYGWGYPYADPYYWP